MIYVSELQVNMLDSREAHQSLGFHVALFTEVVCRPKVMYSRYAYAGTESSDENVHSLDRVLPARTKTKGYM